MDRTLRVVEYTQQVGRSLKNIRNYNPRTTLHTKLPDKRIRARSEDDASTDSNPSQAIPAMIGNSVGDGEAGIYNVHLYANGYHMAKTGDGYMYLPEITYGRNLDVNTRIIVFSSMIETVDGEVIPEEGDES